MPQTPNGWKGVIAHGDGNLEIHPWEAIKFENAGIYVYHNDKYETTTFLPIFTVRSVRWHDAEKEANGPNVEGREIMDYHQKVQRLRAIGAHEEESE